MKNPAIKNVSKDGDVLYLACGQEGSVGLDVSAPREPRMAFRHLDGADFRAAVRAGNLLYTAAALDGVKIFDASALPVLSEVGSYDTAGFASEFVLQDGKLYVADGPAGVLVLDVSNPARPTRVGGNAAVINPVLDTISSLAVIGNRVVVAADRTLQILEPVSLFYSATVSIHPIGVFSMNFDQPVPSTLLLQRSSDLSEWRDWMPIMAGSDLNQFTEWEFSNARQFFYRVRVP